MSRLQQLYHRHVPPRIRFPIGRLRRDLIDVWTRVAGGHGPLPPRRVLQKVQHTVWVMEFLEVGAKCAGTVRTVLQELDLDAPGTRVLDFGCGMGRTLRHFRHDGWQLQGCDVDADSIAWSRRTVPFVALEVNGEEPPLPYADGTFDVVYAISVFSHFPTHLQGPWARELARVLRPGGVALVTTMGPWVFDPLPPSDEASEAVDGFWFVRAGKDFNDSAAIHTEAGLRHFFEPTFETLDWRRGGLDGFQDLGIFRKP